MISALIYPMILGLERLETTHLLTRNGVFQYLTGLPIYPIATTLRRFLLRLAPAVLPRLRRYRFVVIRRPLVEDPSAQLTLFTVKRHTYQVQVTNLDLQPLNLWHFDNDRAALERIIRELKGDYPLGRIPTRHFFANEAYFHLLLLAYNLVNWFKRLCLPAAWHPITL